MAVFGESGAQLAALLRARRAVSRAQRAESPVSWWLKRVFYWWISLSSALTLFAFGSLLPRDDTLDHDRVGMLLLLGPFAAAGYLILLSMRDGPGAHPLGPSRGLQPLSRRRSSALRIGEEVVNPGTLFVAAYGFAPWAGIAAAGGTWLNGWGWCCVVLLVPLAMAWKECVAGFQSWLLEGLTGSVAALARLGLTAAIVVVPVVGEVALRPFGVDGFDFFALPGRQWVNTPVAAAICLAAVPLAFVLAWWVRCWRPWRTNVTWLRRPEPDPRRGAARFTGRSVPGAMLWLMVVRAYRMPAYRYTAVLLVLFGLMLAWMPPQSGIGLLLLAGFLSPMAVFFNLYGQDAPYYALWLASGRTLAEWTATRTWFALGNLAVSAALTLALFFLVRPFPAGQLAGFAAAPALAAAIGVALGPAVSRFTLTPGATDIGARARHTSAARAFLPVAAGYLAAAIALVPAILLTVFGLAWVAWLLAVGSLSAALASRPARSDWSPAFRLRLASAFRE